METAAEYTRRLLKAGARAQKSLGQNFLMDDRVIAAIVGASDLGPGIPVVEVGPGLGVLTRVLAQRVDKLWAIELDRHKLNVLERELAGLPVEFILGDALKIELKCLWGERKGYLVGNLPYYITSPLIMHFLEQGEYLRGMTVMVQKEVADRLVAPPGSKAYGVLSIAAQVSASLQTITDVPPSAFWPSPKVYSTVVRFDLRPYPNFKVPKKEFFKVVKAAFSQRRKTLANSLSGGLGIDKERISRILAGAGISSERRAETLSIDEFQSLTQALVKENSQIGILM